MSSRGLVLLNLGKLTADLRLTGNGRTLWVGDRVCVRLKMVMEYSTVTGRHSLLGRLLRRSLPLRWACNVESEKLAAVCCAQNRETVSVAVPDYKLLTRPKEGRR